MTDWLPWGFVLMAGLFSTIALVIYSMESAPAGKKPDLRLAKIALIITVIASLAVYALYLIYGESWVWYLRR